MGILSDSFIANYVGRQPKWGFNGLGYIVYKRTYARDVEGESRKEEWWETIQRGIEGAQRIGAGYTEAEAERLFDYIFNLKGCFSGRALWQLGTPLVDKFGGGSAVNCCYTDIEEIDDFNLLFDMLMLGCGVGYSVERSKIHNFPKVMRGVKITHEESKDADIIVPDSRHGWSRLLHSVLKSYFYTGKSFSYSTILVRGYGEKLKTFGGTASGPQALIDGIRDICKVLDNRAGKKVRSVDVLDIANIIGRIVVSGSSRRSAQIAIGDPDDFLFLRAKNWGTGKIPAWRSNSNNSLYADSYEEVIDEFWKGYDGSGEPYGLLNRNLARTQGRLGDRIDDPEVEGTNPCGEIFLASGEVCNLSTIFLPNVASEEELIDLSTLLYKTQKAITLLDYPHQKTTDIVHKNMRLGQSITGWLQASEEQWSWTSHAYDALKSFDKEWSAQIGVAPSIKLTTGQPSGTLSLLAGVTAGISPGHDQFCIRRVIIGSADPLVEYCRAKGYPTEYKKNLDGTQDYTQIVVEFPATFGENAVLAKDLTAFEHLEFLKKVQTEWADNAVSCTILYRKDELPEIKDWLKENYENSIKSVSFLLHTGHGFVQAPWEEITEAEYNKRVKAIKENVQLGADNTADVLDMECSGGACPIR